MTSDSSDDDRPLARPNGNLRELAQPFCGFSASENGSHYEVSQPAVGTLSRADDRALDKAQSKRTSGMAGMTVSSGPVDDSMDLDTPNGSKRKSRSSISRVSYKDASESDDEPQ
ncbi:hypothetical protein E4U53_007210, partial [Claviceps sorghi]